MAKIVQIFLTILIALPSTAQQSSISWPDGRQMSISAIDSIVRKLMDTAEVSGLCLGIVQDGQVAYVQAYGYKNKPLKQFNDTATCFYGASLSKSLFGYLVMHLVDRGQLDLDKPLYTYLPKPLPDYEKYADLAGDDRWKLVTARHCLDHSTGFPNWRFFNPVDSNKLEFFFTPGTRYAYSGEGLVLLQMVVEHITGRGLEDLAREYAFRPFGMRRSSYLWQPAFESDYAVAHLIEEDTLGKGKRKKTNAAGSLETTVADYTRFLAAVMRGDGLSPKAWQEMLSPQLAIYSRRQFPSLDTATSMEFQKIKLSYGLGWGLFTSPYGKAFFKEGHDEGWAHYALCLADQKQAILIMTNSSNGESIFKELFEKLAGVTIPWQWEDFTPYRATVKLRPDILQQYFGNYVGKYNAYFKMTDGHFTVESPDAKLGPTRLHASNDQQFFLKTMATEIRFVRGSDSNVSRVSVTDDGEHYDLVKVKDTILPVARLRKLQGDYQVQADHHINIKLSKGRLYADATDRKDGINNLELHPYSATEFYLTEAALKFRFVFDEKGHSSKLITFGSAAPPADWVNTK